MAEVFGIIGAAVGVAAEGLRLSQTLYEFVGNVRLADTDIKEVADDVSSTAVVLQQFEASLKLDEESMICTSEFYKVTSENIEGCSAAFASIDKALQKSIRAVKDAPATSGNVDQVFELRKRDKFWWPFNKQRVENHRRNLDRLKANLNLKMQVMAHAREIHERQKASRANENEEKIKALRVEALALEAQEAERKYQETESRTAETQMRLQKEPEKGVTNNEKDSRRTSSNRSPESSQRPEAEGQNGDFEDPSLNGPSSDFQYSTGKLSGEDRAQDISSLTFSKIEVLLSRIAGAQEAIVLAAEKRGPPVRFTDSTRSFNSEPLQQIGGASRARVIRGAHGEDLQQNARDSEDENQRRFSDPRPLDRIARVQERLVELSHIDPFALREESAESEDDYIYHTPIEGIENMDTIDGSQKPIQRGEHAVRSVTNAQLVEERIKNELRVALENDRPSFEAEPHGKINNEELIPMPNSNRNEGSQRELEGRVKSKGKDKQYALEQVPLRPRHLRDLTENSTPLEATDDAGIERAQRLTPSTGALVLYADRSTWVRRLPYGSGATFNERKLSLHLPESLPLSSSTVTNKSPNLLTATDAELQPSLPTLRGTIETLTNPKMTAEPNLDKTEERKPPIKVKKAKPKERGEHQLLKATMPQRHSLRKQGSEGGNTGNMEPADQESTRHDQINSQKHPSIANEPTGSLQGKRNRDHEAAEDAGLSRNHEKLNTTDDQTPHPPLRTVPDPATFVAEHAQISNGQGSGAPADNSNAAEADNQHINESLGEDQSGSVEPIIVSYSRLARLRAFLSPRFIRRHEISRMISDNAKVTHASSISGKSDRERRPRTHGLRFSRRLTMLINPRRMKKRGSTLKRNVKTWLLASRRLSSSISSRSHPDNSSYSYYTYTESSDEEGINQSAIVRPRIGENSPESEPRERISSRRHSYIRLNVPSASIKPPSQEIYHRNSRQQTKHQKPNKPSEVADERAAENLLPNHNTIPNDPLLDIPVVADLDQSSNFVTTGFIGSYDQPILEAWLLRPNDPPPGHSTSWRRARRIFMPLGTEELEAEVEKFDQKTKKRRSKPVWTVLRTLSSDQQQQIERLLDMKRACDGDRRFQWTLVALKVGPGASFKPNSSLYIQVILKRFVNLNAWRATIDPPLASGSYPLPATNVNMIAKPPQAPRRYRYQQSSTPSDSDEVINPRRFEGLRRRGSLRSIPPSDSEDTIYRRFELLQRQKFLREWLRHSIAPSNSKEDLFSGRFQSSRRERSSRIITPSDSDENIISRRSRRMHSRRSISPPHAPPGRQYSPASSSARRRSFSGSEGVRVFGMSSNEQLTGRNHLNRFGSSRKTEEARRRTEQEVKRDTDQRSRKKSGVDDSGKGKAEKGSERATGLGTVDSRITGLERMLKNHETTLERLRTEEMKRRSVFQSPLDISGGERLSQSQRSHDRRLFDDQKEPLIPRSRSIFQPLSDPSSYRNRDPNALDFYSPSSSSSNPFHARRNHEYAPRSRSPTAIYINNSARELPTSANERSIRQPRPRRSTVDIFRERPAKPVVRFQDSKPSTSQDPSTALDFSDSKNSQPLDLSGPLFGPAGSQYRSPSPMAPGTSMPPLNPTLNNLISQWTTLKLDIPKEQQQQQPTNAASSPSNEGKKGRKRQPRPLSLPQITNPDQPSTYNETSPYGSAPAVSPLNNNREDPDRRPRGHENEKTDFFDESEPIFIRGGPKDPGRYDDYYEYLVRRGEKEEEEEREGGGGGERG